MIHTRCVRHQTISSFLHLYVNVAIKSSDCSTFVCNLLQELLCGLRDGVYQEPLPLACPESGRRPSTHHWQGRADSVSDASAPGHSPERRRSQTGGRALPPRGPRCGCRRYRQASRLQAIFRFRTPGITKKCAFQRHKRLPCHHLWFISRDARTVPKWL